MITFWLGTSLKRQRLVTEIGRGDREPSAAPASQVEPSTPPASHVASCGRSKGEENFRGDRQQTSDSYIPWDHENGGRLALINRCSLLGIAERFKGTTAFRDSRQLQEIVHPISIMAKLDQQIAQNGLSKGTPHRVSRSLLLCSCERKLFNNELGCVFKLQGREILYL